jgi:hypothetical protein
MNAAEFLYDFFDKESVYDADQAGYRFPDLVAALDEIGKAIDQWEREGRRVKGFRSSLPRWRKSVTMAFTDTARFVGMRSAAPLARPISCPTPTRTC